MPKSRSKRLRKKLFVDEFAVYGFSIVGTIVFASEAESDVFLDKFLAVIDSLNLRFSGWLIGNILDGFIVAEGRYASPTEYDKEKLYQWVKTYHNCQDAQVSNLVDANYGG